MNVMNVLWKLILIEMLCEHSIPLKCKILFDCQRRWQGKWPSRCAKENSSLQNNRSRVLNVAEIKMNVLETDESSVALSSSPPTWNWLNGRMKPSFRQL